MSGLSKRVRKFEEKVNRNTLYVIDDAISLLKELATVKFVAEVISVKKDKEGKIIEGNPDKIKYVTDIWKFTRNIKDKSPNWYLAEIISQ